MEVQEVKAQLIRVRGRDLIVDSISVGNLAVIRTGTYCKVAQLFDDFLVEEADTIEPAALIDAVRSSPLRADIFLFAEHWAKPQPVYDFPFVWDNVAVVATHSFDQWWKGLPQESRKNVRLAAKRGVVVKAINFDDALVSGIRKIYAETPFRQGRRFWHYKISFDRVKELNSTYLDRSKFIGAYLDGKLIGFTKYIRVDATAVLIQILAMEVHRDKRVTNALLRHTVEACCQEGLTALTYGKFSYGVHKESSLTEFKRRNGFREQRFRRYVVPLTVTGRIMAFGKVYSGIQGTAMASVTTFLHRVRSRCLRVIYYNRIPRRPRPSSSSPFSSS